MPRFTFNWFVGLQERISPAINKIRNAIEAIRSKQVSIGVRSLIDSKVNVDTTSIGEAAGVLNRTRKSALSLAASFENIQRLKDVVPQEQFEALNKFLSSAEYPGIAEFVHTLFNLSKVSGIAATTIQSDVESLRETVISSFADLVGELSKVPLEQQKEVWERAINAIQSDFKNLQQELQTFKPTFPTVEELGTFIEQFPQAFTTAIETLQNLPTQFVKIIKQLESSYETLEFEPVQAPDVSNVVETLQVLREGFETGIKPLVEMRNRYLQFLNLISSRYKTREAPEDVLKFVELFTNQIDPMVVGLQSVLNAFDQLTTTIQKSNEIVGIQGEKYRVLLNTRFKPARELMQQYGVSLDTVIKGLEMMTNRLKDTSAAMMTAIRWDPAAFIEQTGLAAFSTSAALDMLAYTHEELRHELIKTREEANKLSILLKSVKMSPEDYQRVSERLNELQVRMNSLGLQMKFLRYVMKWTAKYAEEYFPMGRDPVMFERMKRIEDMRQRLERFGASMKQISWLLTWASLSLLGVFFSTQWFVNMTYGTVERYVKLLANWADAAFDVAQWMAVASYIGLDIGKILGGQAIEDIIQTIITGGMRAQSTFAALTSVFAYFVAYALSNEDVWVAMRTAFEKFVTLLWENRDLIVGFIKGLFIGFGWVLSVFKALLDIMKTTLGIENVTKAFELLGIIVGIVAGTFMVLGPVLTFIMMGFQGLGAAILIAGTLLPKLISGLSVFLRVGLAILPVIAEFAWLIPIIAGIALVVYDATQGFIWIRSVLINVLVIIQQLAEAGQYLADALVNVFVNPQKAAQSFQKSLMTLQELFKSQISLEEWSALVARKFAKGQIPEWLYGGLETKELKKPLDLNEIQESTIKIRESLHTAATELKDVPDTLDVMAVGLNRTFEEIKPTIKEFTQQLQPTITPTVAPIPEKSITEEKPIESTLPMMPQTTYFYVTINAQNVTTESIPAIQEMLRKEYINLTNQTMLYKNR